MVSPARDAAFRALLRVDRGRLDDSLAALPELDTLDGRDRALANELVTGTVKRRLSLDAVLGAFTRAPLATTDRAVLEALRLAAFQLLFLDRVPAHAAVDDAVALLAAKGTRVQSFANAVLRKVSAAGTAKLVELSAGDGAHAWSVRHSAPVWLIRLLRAELGDNAAAQVLAAANAAPERCLRVNTLRATVAEAAAALAAEGFTTSLIAGLPEALLYGGPALERAAAFRDGLVTPQSRGSQLAGLVSLEGALGLGGPAAGEPGGEAAAPLRVLDLCAAPGTKTGQLAAGLPGAQLTAVDVDAGRLAELRVNLARLGAADVTVAQADVLALPDSYDGAFDAVLLDAPCSGLGTLASRPDLRWRRHATDVGRLAALQQQLIARAARCVRPGGALTYAVCTLPRAETIDVIAPLLADGWVADDLGATRPQLAHPALPAALLVLPPDFGTTGFFVARLRPAAG